MSIGIVDDDDQWKVPETKADTDQAHEARVRFLCHALAQRILAIPADASKQSRAIRISKARDKVRDKVEWLCEAYVYCNGLTVRIREDREWSAWLDAHCAAWSRVKTALDAGVDLTAFLFPSEEASSEAAA